MTQNTTKDCDNKNNSRANILQIIFQNELIYMMKFVAFIFMAVTIFIGLKKANAASTKDFAGIFIFVLSTAIDAVVLAKAFKVKGKINIILFIFISILFLSFGFVALIFTGQLEISLFLINICGYIGFLCCLSPILEMIYDIIWRLQNEKQRNY